jgi:RNA polymerase sigma factor (sigma-70 family)
MAAEPDPRDDDTLMRAYAQGDARAFERLYARHSGALYRFVRHVPGREAAAQADEVFQDTWLRVARSRERWRPQGATFRTWLFTLAHHRAIDVLRRSGREFSVGDGQEGEPWQPDADADAWRDWRRERAAADNGRFALSRRPCFESRPKSPARCACRLRSPARCACRLRSPARCACGGPAPTTSRTSTSTSPSTRWW